MKPADTPALPPAPPAARTVFSTTLPLIERYAGLLATDGTVRGLIGPREVPRLWERHLVNCALVADLIGPGDSVCDIGSGAGLPGIPMALARPDLRVTLVEPLLRRTTFLEEVVADLGLENVEVVRGRAEELHGARTFDVVTSRAVAPLPKLLRWSVPLARAGGLVLAMKGSSAAEEVSGAAKELRRLGVVRADVVEVGSGVVSPPTVLVRVEVGGSGRLGSGSAPDPSHRDKGRPQ